MVKPVQDISFVVRASMSAIAANELNPSRNFFLVAALRGMVLRDIQTESDISIRAVDNFQHQAVRSDKVVLKDGVRFGRCRRIWLRRVFLRTFFARRLFIVRSGRHVNLLLFVGGFEGRPLCPFPAHLFLMLSPLFFEGRCALLLMLLFLVIVLLLLLELLVVLLVLLLLCVLFRRCLR